MFQLYHFALTGFSIKIAFEIVKKDSIDITLHLKEKAWRMFLVHRHFVIKPKKLTQILVLTLT